MITTQPLDAALEVVYLKMGLKLILHLIMEVLCISIMVKYLSVERVVATKTILIAHMIQKALRELNSLMNNVMSHERSEPRRALIWRHGVALKGTESMTGYTRLFCEGGYAGD